MEVNAKYYEVQLLTQKPEELGTGVLMELVYQHQQKVLLIYQITWHWDLRFAN